MENIKNINLESNNIYFLNTLKKIRAFYHEEKYKNKDLEVVKVNIKQIKKFTKLNSILEELILPTLLEYGFLTNENKNYIISIEHVNFYFENIDTKKIEKEFLLKEQGLSIETAKKIIETADLSFNDKVQKIYSNVEKISEDKEVLKQLIDEKLEENEDYVELLNQLEEIKEQIKNKKLELIDTNLEEKENEIKTNLKEEKSTLNEFLEFSAEKGELSKIDIVNKDGKSLKPIMKFSMKPVKKEKIKAE